MKIRIKMKPCHIKRLSFMIEDRRLLHEDDPFLDLLKGGVVEVEYNSRSTLLQINKTKKLRSQYYFRVMDNGKLKELRYKE